MTKKEVAPLLETVDKWYDDIQTMIETVEKHNKWAEKVAKKADTDNQYKYYSAEEYELADRIICFQQGLNQMDRQI